MEAINIQLVFGFINDFIAAIRRGSYRGWEYTRVYVVLLLCSSANCGKLSLACCCCCRCCCCGCVCVCVLCVVSLADDIFTSSKGFYDINSCRWQIIVAIILAATELGPKAEGRQRHVESIPYQMWGGSLQGVTAGWLVTTQHPVGNTYMLLAQWGDGWSGPAGKNSPTLPSLYSSCFVRSTGNCQQCCHCFWPFIVVVAVDVVGVAHVTCHLNILRLSTCEQ